MVTPAGEDQQEEREAVDHGGFTVIGNGQKPGREVFGEVRKRHRP
jgi:hypothetical protein